MAADGVAPRYVNTTDAARYFGVCTKTFQRMLTALPAHRRPVQRQWPGTTVKRWDLQELDAAFSARTSSGWDRISERRR